MSYKIENQFLLIEFSLKGGEIIRFFDKENNQDIVWQNKPEIWKYQTPFLFPKIGSLNPNQYHVGENQYKLENHGFFRTSNLIVEKQSETTISFILKENEETLSRYPYQFEFRLNYTLENQSLNINVEIKNKDKKVMPFELGYHPAFQISRYLDTKIVFPTQFVERYSYLNKTDLRVRRRTRNVIHIAQRFFERRGTLIYKGIKTPYVLVTPNYKLQFESNDFEYLAIWSNNEQFVCVEPWSNLPDLFENKVNWIDRDHITRLAPNEIKNYSLKLTVI